MNALNYIIGRTTYSLPVPLLILSMLPLSLAVTEVLTFPIELSQTTD